MERIGILHGALTAEESMLAPPLDIQRRLFAIVGAESVHYRRAGLAELL